MISFTSSFTINVTLRDHRDTVCHQLWCVLEGFLQIFQNFACLWVLQAKLIWFGALHFPVSHYFFEGRQCLCKLSDFEAWINSLIPELGKSLNMVCSLQIPAAFSPKSLVVQSVHVKSAEGFCLILIQKIKWCIIHLQKWLVYFHSDNYYFVCICWFVKSSKAANLIVCLCNLKWTFQVNP